MGRLEYSLVDMAATRVLQSDSFSKRINREVRHRPIPSPHFLHADLVALRCPPSPETSHLLHRLRWPGSTASRARNAAPRPSREASGCEARGHRRNGSAAIRGCAVPKKRHAGGYNQRSVQGPRRAFSLSSCPPPPGKNITARLPANLSLFAPDPALHGTPPLWVGGGCGEGP